MDFRLLIPLGQAKIRSCKELPQDTDHNGFWQDYLQHVTMLDKPQTTARCNFINYCRLKQGEAYFKICFYVAPRYVIYYLLDTTVEYILHIHKMSHFTAHGSKLLHTIKYIFIIQRQSVYIKIPVLDREQLKDVETHLFDENVMWIERLILISKSEQLQCMKMFCVRLYFAVCKQYASSYSVRFSFCNVIKTQIRH